MENIIRTEAPEPIKSDDKGVTELLEVGRQQTQGFMINGIPALAMPAGHKLKMFEDLAASPPRVVEDVELHDIDSLIEYYKRYATEHSMIFIDKKGGRFVAVFDYHQVADNIKGASFCSHKARFQVKKTEDWSDWLSVDGVKRDQVKTAEFIDDHLDTIIDPDGAAMLEIATSFSAKTNIDFKQATRLDNGQVQFKYNETLNGVAGKSGEISIPSEIKLGIVPFEGADRYEIKAKFRWRLNSGNLALSFHLRRPDKVWEVAINDTTAKLRESFGVGTIVNGEHFGKVR